MKKIPTIFLRDRENGGRVRDEITPGTEWVRAGEGIATLKLDGTCCLIRDGRLYKRHEVKPGRKPPPDFEQTGGADPETGKLVGWLPVGDGPEDRWHREGLGNLCAVRDGTYELCGPKIQGNPEGVPAHSLARHGACVMSNVPTDFAGLRDFLKLDIEGIVWWRDPSDPDCDKAKIKGKDFGIKRGG